MIDGEKVWMKVNNFIMERDDVKIFDGLSLSELHNKERVKAYTPVMSWGVTRRPVTVAVFCMINVGMKQDDLKLPESVLVLSFAAINPVLQF